MKRIFLVATLVLAALWLGACGAGFYYVSTAPPPARVTGVVGVAPGSGFVWVDGYWGWSGGMWLWTEGRWMRPPHPHAIWVAPGWERHGQRYRYHPGRWR